MAFVDDDEEEELVPQSVSNYYFEDDYKEPLSFAVLPIQWSSKESVEESDMDVFLRGTPDNGLPSLYKPVKAWKIDLSNKKPEISVLTKDNIWIKLQKPRKSFEGLIRTVLVTVHSLHFLKRSPEASEKSLWEHLSRVFGLCDVKPSRNDLVDHMDLMGEAVRRDDSLAKSKFLLAFLEEKPTKKRLPDEDNPRDSILSFIVDDMIEDVDEDDMDDDDYFEAVCAICDNGGDILCCEGSCLRSFHATKEDGQESLCESLGLTKKQVEAIQKFYCKNCELKKHLCFICKKLGSSDKSAGAEVFQCVSATCGYYYHPRCVARLLHKGNKDEAEVLEKRIAAGESFTCPLHKCCICKQGEDKTDCNLQFAVCRRCPKSYHRKCLPRKIAFKDIVEEGIFTRAWDDLLHNRVLIYCLEHEIDDLLETPLRDHVQFPVAGEKKIVAKVKRKVQDSYVGSSKAGMMEENLNSGYRHEIKASVKSPRDSFPASGAGASSKKQVLSSKPDAQRRGQEVDASRKSFLPQKKSQKVEVNKAREVTKSTVSLGARLFNYMHDSEQVKAGKAEATDSEANKAIASASKKPSSELVTLDNDSERRLLALMNEATASISIGDIIKKHKVPSTHTSSIKHIVEKTITWGKVEGSVQAVRTALAKLNDGNNLEDAKAVCEPEVLNQIFKWKDKLKVYLAPFLYGSRYTSFGRHFTKVDKLQEIVDRLHWYAQDGDMIVDFCCGANDFSILMKRKLEETGKKCLFKNYDILQAKNDFCFEKKDWMTVRKDELPPGSKLIMGLNPPFGVKAALANKFINKALEFQPKLLILIVPVETERLDKKKSPYVLTWEDEYFLSGKSFYLPGSVNDEDKQMDDWNLVSPPLSLWSRPDWAVKHGEIAQKHGHPSMRLDNLDLGKNDYEVNASSHFVGDSVCGYDGTPTLGDSPFDGIGDNSVLINDEVRMEIDEPRVVEVDNEILVPPCKGEAQGSVACGKRESNNLSSKRKEKQRRKNNDCRGMPGKSMDSNDVSSRKNSKEESVRKLNLEGQGTKGKTIERTLDRQGSARSSSRDDMHALHPSSSNATSGRSHELLEASYGGPMRKRNKREEDVGETYREEQGNTGTLERTLDTQSSVRSSRDDLYTVRPSPSDATGRRSHEPFEASHGASLSSFRDDFSGRYEPGGTYRASEGAYLLEQFPIAAHMRDGTDKTLDYRTHSEVGKEAEARARIHLYRQDLDVSVPRGYLQAQNDHLEPFLASAPHGRLVSAPELSSFGMNNASAIQRYAPHLDDLHYQRTNAFRSPLPPLRGNTNSLYDPRGLPLPGDHHFDPTGNNFYDPHVPLQPGEFRAEPMGFAPGPHHPYTFGSSAGWVND